MENKNKVIIGVVLTLGLSLLFIKYRNSKKTVNETPKTTSGNGLNIPPRINPKVEDNPSTGGSLILNNNGQLVTGGVRPPRIEQPIIKEPINEEPIYVTPPAPLPFDFGNGDDGTFVQEPFFGDNLFGGIPNPIITNPIYNQGSPTIPNPIIVGGGGRGDDNYNTGYNGGSVVNQPIYFEPNPLPFDFGNGNTYTPEPIFVTPPAPLPIDFGNGDDRTFVQEPFVNNGFGNNEDTWNAFNNTTYSNSTLLGGGENNIRGFSNLQL